MNYVIYIIKYMIYIYDKIYNKDIIKALEVRVRPNVKSFLI